MTAPDYIIWHINESEEELRSGLSHPEYFIDKIKSLKPGSGRLMEILATRRALKELFYGQEQQVMYNEEGRPFLQGDSAPYISISHTKDYAAVILGETPVGIDIERRGNRVQRVVSRFLKPEEIAVLNLAASMNDKLSPEESLCLAMHLSWSAKEAAFKILGRKYYDLQNLTSVEQIDWQSCQLTLRVSGFDEPMHIHFDFTDEYVLAWVQARFPHI